MHKDKKKIVRFSKSKNKYYSELQNERFYMYLFFHLLYLIGKFN